MPESTSNSLMGQMSFQAAILMVVLTVGIGCQNQQHPHVSQQTEASDVEVVPEKIQTRILPNVVRLHTKVISGGLPEGDQAFEELNELGIKTIISVDGMKPDVALARRNGLRYVHLPHGYDGISDDRAKELAKAVRELDGPIYIHCHHGKHRSPAAATVACVGAGMIHPAIARTVLETAGTSPDYLGLYKSAESAQQFDARLLDALQVEFQSIAQVPEMAEAMVELEKPYHHLKEFSKNDWGLLDDHPDITPAHEALILREHFTELLRSTAEQDYPPSFRDWLQQSETAAIEIEGLLKEKSGFVTATPDNATHYQSRLDAALNQISHDCRACHRAFRDVPRVNRQ